MTHEMQNSPNKVKQHKLLLMFKVLTINKRKLMNLNQDISHSLSNSYSTIVHIAVRCSEQSWFSRPYGDISFQHFDIFDN